MASRSLLKSIRERLHETADEVAAAVSISQSSYSRIEQGLLSVTAIKAAEIAQHFGVPVRVIFNPHRYLAVFEDASLGAATRRPAFEEQS